MDISIRNNCVLEIDKDNFSSRKYETFIIVFNVTIWTYL